MKINYVWNKVNYGKFLTYLKSIADNDTKKFNERIVNTKYEILGIKMPVLKMIAKDISKTDYFKFLELSTSKYYEEVMIEGFLLSYIKDENVFLDYLNKFIYKIDSWAICDSCISSYKIFKKGDFSSYASFLVLDSREFFVRVGYIILLDYYIDDDHIDNILSLCLKESSYYYVNMAVSWLISVCFIKYREKVLDLLKSKKLSVFVQNKTISKIRDSYRVSREDKEIVKSLTI